jgi:hypothetical protein
LLTYIEAVRAVGFVLEQPLRDAALRVQLRDFRVNFSSTYTAAGKGKARRPYQHDLLFHFFRRGEFDVSRIRFGV